MLTWKNLLEKRAKGERMDLSSFSLPFVLEVLLLSARLCDYGIQVTLGLNELLNANPAFIREMQAYMGLISPDEMRGRRLTSFLSAAPAPTDPEQAAQGIIQELSQDAP